MENIFKEIVSIAIIIYIAFIDDPGNISEHDIYQGGYDVHKE